ncbi:MAG: hypothetical protein KBI07_07805 [Candidatus Atribacteria bacterium]|nr:hypothetical protein [Candidatus Atribacteria bacterium]
MNNGGIIVIVLSFLSIIISLFAIWLAIAFYRLYTQLSLIMTEVSKGLAVSTIRLERLPKILYNQDLIFPKSAPEDEQNINNNNINRDIKEKKEPSNIQPLNGDSENIAQKQDKESKNKMQDRDFASQILSGGEEI